MMKVGHPSKLRVLLITLIFGSVMLLAQAKRADAYAGLGFLLFTYFTVVGTVCTPVAAAKASDYPGGFSEAFKDCISLEMKQTYPAKDREADKPTEAEEANRNKDSHQEE